MARYIEQYLDVVQAEGGINTALPTTLGNSVTISGSTTAAGAIRIGSGVATTAGGATGGSLIFGSAQAVGIYFGSGAPTITAPKGSLYLRTDGSTTNDRAYINTNAGTTWTALTTAT